MKNKHIIIPIALCTLAFAACTDNNYDLSDIDTTARVNVNDFALKARSVTVKLDDVLDISDGSKIQKIPEANGKKIYAVKESGTISKSKDIRIPSFTAPGKVATITPEPINFMSLVSAKTRAGISGMTVTADIPTKETSISLSADNVDNAVTNVTHIGVNTDVVIKVQFTGIATALKQLHISNLNINFVKGLDATVDGGSYNPETGVISLGDKETTEKDGNLEYAVTVHVNGIHVGNGKAAQFADHKFTFNTVASVVEGATISAGINDLKTNASLPTTAGYIIRAEVKDIKATTFSGNIDYTVENIASQYVNLTDLPDMLRDTQTSIELSNPMIKLNVTNPVADYVGIQAGLSITGHSAYSTDKDAIKMTSAENTINLMPEIPTDLPTDGSQYVKFADLGKVLSGAGLPSQLRIDVLSPKAIGNDVKDFPLGTTYEGVGGSWEFYAPLSLTDKSKIRYEKEWDDWGDEDLDHLCLNSATVTANIDSDVPLEIELDLVMTGKTGTMTAEKVTIEPNASDAPVTFNLKGDLKGVKGMKVEAHLTGSNGTLKPDQNIVLKNIAAKVNGYYEEKL